MLLRWLLLLLSLLPPLATAPPPTLAGRFGRTDSTGLMILAEVILAVGAFGIYTVVLPKFIPKFTTVRRGVSRREMLPSLASLVVAMGVSGGS